MGRGAQRRKHGRQHQCPAVAVRHPGAACRLGRRRAVPGAGHALVLPPPHQQRHPGTQHPPAHRAAVLQADAARGAHRPPLSRRAHPGRRRGACEGGRRGAGRRAPPHRSLRARNRALLQRLPLLPHRLLAGEKRRAPALPRAPGLCRRGRPGGGRPEVDRGLRHEPPQQYGLRAGRLPRRRAGGALLRRRRMGAHLGVAGPDPLDGRLLRAAQLGRSALPRRALALRRHGHRGRRAAGAVPRGRPHRRRRAAPAEVRPARLHGEILSCRRRARPGIHPRRPQLRPRAGGPQPAAQAGGAAAPAPC